jgi:hypothetical protein
LWLLPSRDGRARLGGDAPARGKGDAMQASVGDHLHIHSRTVGEHDQVGEIV